MGLKELECENVARDRVLQQAVKIMVTSSRSLLKAWNFLIYFFTERVIFMDTPMANTKTFQHSVSGSESDHPPHPAPLLAPNRHTTHNTHHSSPRADPGTSHIHCHTVNTRAATEL